MEKDPSFVLGLKIPAFTLDDNRYNHNLPTPDFDETGFLGREKKFQELSKACLGPYPVISIVGEGGLGKTALALKLAYEILDLENSPFDAVVWSSSKTSQLTPNEVVDIEHAIRDSLGIFTEIANYLAGQLTKMRLKRYYRI